MKADLYSATGEKKGRVDLPATLFEAKVRPGLMHLAVTVQLSSRRRPVAHTLARGEVRGSTRKLYAQKHTGRARRGAASSPLLRGGGRAFALHADRNFRRTLPHEQRRQALISCLSAQAKRGSILVLEGYADEVKTKNFVTMYRKLPVPHGRCVVFVLDGAHRGLTLSSRNVPGVATLDARRLNPHDVPRAHALVFLKDALGVAGQVFGEKKPKKPRSPTSAKRSSSVSSASSESSDSSS